MAHARRLVERRRDGRVLVISMRRAEKRNAIDRALADALDAALNELDDDERLWAGVLTGTPDVFSAGSDLTAGGDYVTSRGGEYGIIRRNRRKPLVAAVEGPALGGGLEIVLACDLVVAATSARFGSRAKRRRTDLARRRHPARSRLPLPIPQREQGHHSARRLCPH